MAERTEPNLFAEAGELLRMMVPDGLGELRTRAHRRGIKVWFGPEKPTREHYEAQLIPRRLVDDREGAVLEIGFHVEHSDERTNQAVADQLQAKRKVWARELGPSAELDAFLGRDSWRRLSEIWEDVAELEADPEAPFEIACRLVDYVSVIEPIRLGG
ncbi:MAG: hypothetical protein O3C27_06220 [Actinomycetota bacterium]|nr:hypothetical protein [Actinomycetota bacterium]